MRLAGLRSSNGRGSFKAARYAADGSLILLYDGGDGLRLLKTDASATNITGEVREGAAGDAGVAMAIDPSGNLYVAGTSTSGALAGTAGAAFSQPADASTNSFLAKFDPNLNLLFLTFLGASKTAVTAVAASGDAVFVAGGTYNHSLPVTRGALQPAPLGNTLNAGFVECFSSDGTALRYATYLTGAGGDTLPTAITADANDDAYIAGETSAAGFPTAAALQPAILGSTSGFLTKLTPAGNGIVFSTFIAGAGVTSLTLDAAADTLLLSGNVSLGQFPVATVAAPIANTSYQTLLRITADGGSVPESVLLVPGSQSFVTAGPNGSAWVSGSLTTPLFPGAATPFSEFGDSFLLHVAQSGDVVQSFRAGGLPIDNASYASLTSSAGAPAITANGATATLPGTLAATASAPLAAMQRFDIPLTGPTPALPNAPGDLLPSSCPGLSDCSGSAGLLTTVSTAATAAAFTLSVGDLPNLILRNASSIAAANLAITASGYEVAADCGSSLLPGSQCTLALSGSGPRSLTVSAANANPLTVTPPATNASPDALTLSAAELDFGIVTASNSPPTRAIAVTNLTGNAQSFTSAGDGGPATPPYTLAESGSTCAGSANAHTVAANSTCTVTLALSASSSPGNDGSVAAFWKIGPRAVAITGITQAADLSVSASEVDFGVQLTGSTPQLPRYLYLSNSSGTPTAHTPVSLPGDSPFSVSDACPSTLEPASVCQLTLHYAQPTSPSTDTTTLTLDEGLIVLITGQTQSPATAGEPANPGLSISPASFGFSSPVAVSGISSETAVFTVSNTGSSTLPLAATSTGDFLLTSSCGTTLTAGASCVLSLQFAPSQPGIREGSLSIACGPGFAPTTVPVSGTGTGLIAVSNGTVTLGQTPVGEPAFAWYRVQTSLPNLTASVTGSAFGVALVEDNGTGHGSLPASAFAPAASGPCANCWLGVVFIPQTVGPAGATLSLMSVPGGNPYPLAVTGTGVPVQGLVFSPASEDFGTVPLGSSSASQTFTLANLLSPATGAVVQGIAATGDFQVVPNTTGGTSCAGALASTASCFVELSFVPTALGQRTGTLTVKTAAGTATATLTGSAVASSGLSLSPTALNFSNAPGAAGTQQTLTLQNTGATALTIGSVSSSNAHFTTAGSCTVLAPGASCSLSAVFTPGDSYAAGALTIPVSTANNGGSSPVNYTVPLSGNYTSNESGLLLLPAEANFGAQAAGSLGLLREFTLRNISDTAQSIALTTAQQFPLAAPFACTTLAAGADCTFTVSFLPETGGALTGTLLATASSADGVTSQALGYLLGYGTASGALTISGQPIPNAPVNFGEVSSGGSAAQTLTLTNSGTGPLTVRRIVSSPPFFAGSSCGQTLAPSASCSVSLTYAPTYELSTAATSLVPRADAETLIIESDAASSPDEVELQGSVVPLTSSTPAANTSLASYTLSQGSLTFANTQVGDTSPVQTLTLMNSGSTTLAVSGISAPQDYVATTDCAALTPGSSCSIQVAFTPGDSITTALRAGTLEIQSNASAALEFVSLLGSSSAAPLTLSPLELNFGTVSVGQSGQLTVNATNTASLPITFGQLSTTGDYTADPGTCPPPGAPLPAGQSCTMIITFAPTATGSRTGTLSVGSNATEAPLTVILTGAAVASRLQISPGALDFGSVGVNASTSRILNLVNSGSGSLSGLAASINGANPGDFSITAPCTTTTLSPFTSCTLQVTFKPSAIGTRSASLLVTSSDPAGPTTIPLTGNGAQAGGGTPSGSFVLTVAGGNAWTATVGIGLPAIYALTVTPQSGYTGPIALTCTPVAAAPFGACSLLGSQLMLSGSAQGATATITTIGGIRSGWLSPIGILLFAPLSLPLRRKRGSGLRMIGALCFAFVAAMGFLSLSGCGSVGSSGQNITPPGTYQYIVTASSTSGVQASSSVTLGLVVRQ